MYPFSSVLKNRYSKMIGFLRGDHRFSLQLSAVHHSIVITDSCIFIHDGKVAAPFTEEYHSCHPSSQSHFGQSFLKLTISSSV